MKTKKKILAIIPAKSISKRIPGKNIKDLAGKPMISYILETAMSARGLDRVIVSTDSEQIAKIAIQHGAEVPFMRPKYLTEDDVTSQMILKHAIDWLSAQEGYEPDYVLLLYPTSPLLSKKRVEEAIEIALSRDPDSVFSGSYDTGHYWVEVEGGWERLYPKKQVNSQYQIPLVVEDGAIYLTKTRFLHRQYVADKADVLIMDPDENIDVDYPEDFERVEAILKARKKDGDE
ncbi:MAG: acylneuraminate cytidylyltransferase family protein [Candidatus Harrisonbacteria bacterium]|nr:acylneuraminate cytidylyltransferase family protein [Candidatus Harrisonbacteria bacterium]